MHDCVLNNLCAGVPAVNLCMSTMPDMNIHTHYKFNDLPLSINLTDLNFRLG